MTDNPGRKKRIIGLVAALAVAAVVLPGFGVLVIPGFFNQSQDAADISATTSTTPPPLTIKPVQLRPVNGAYVIRPGDCDPPPPTPPDAPLRICDFQKSAVFDLGPQALTLQLTDVDSFLNPLTAKQLVQITMTPESARAFGDYTAAHIDQQLAFIRSGVVVWAPKITERIDGEVLQLSGEDVTEEQAREMARMLKDET